MDPSINYILKMTKFLIGFCLVIDPFPCFSLPNFVLMNSYPHPLYIEYKTSKTNFLNEDAKLQQNLHKYDAKCEKIFSFYFSSNGEMPNIVTRKNNMVFLYTGKNKLEPLGFVLPSRNKILQHMENSVAEGKLLLGFKNKAHAPVAFVQDNKGIVYSVTRLSKQHYSIQTLGILANNI